MVIFATVSGTFETGFGASCEHEVSQTLVQHTFPGGRYPKRSIGKVPGHYRSRNAKETRHHTSTTPRQVRQYKQSRANERRQIQRDKKATRNVQGKQRHVQQKTRSEEYANQGLVAETFDDTQIQKNMDVFFRVADVFAHEEGGDDAVF